MVIHRTYHVCKRRFLDIETNNVMTAVTQTPDYCLTKVTCTASNQYLHGQGI